MNRTWTRGAVVPALLLLLGGCALPNCSPKATGVTGTPAAITTGRPSPTPTPTAPLQASTPPFHTGEVGVDYAPVTLAATGGVRPYTWTISSGALPDGLNLGGDGTVSGTPTRAGGYSFTVQLSDAGGAATALPSTIAIAAAPAASLISACARYCSVEVGCVDVCGGFGTLSGGTAPFTYAVQAGGLIPVGTHLSQLSLAGTFTQRAQFWQFTVVVTDALGQTASITPTFYVFPHISFPGPGLCRGSYVAPCQAQLPYSGGTPGGTPIVKVVGFAQYCTTTCSPMPTSPPPTFTITVGGGSATITVQKACGYPQQGGCPNGWFGIVYLNATDQSPCAQSANCSSLGNAALTIQMVGG